MTQPLDCERLTLFHSIHFPGQPIPKLVEHGQHTAQEADSDHKNQNESGDGLGYYEDGVERTLTDEQIEMFRHSEIQRLLNERRAARQKEEKRKLRKERDTENPGAFERKRRRFADQPPAGQPSIDMLMYDDVKGHNVESGPATKKFMWPKIDGH
ncbi:hypothetical protein A1O1_05118 [Capronia coronata CBS 617.96]|uniref:Uncharacterized protein n=1 Tax=Capronia coronata CBS 617.96 TaxID=1182541 RepID=W9Y6M5_9EURO|nr:uncharacterized protein A1O1_05118 [Capronia coronata CBS 617.96]EXJ88188.1 hypothetical protein A1O1_05118 [Capronia coronata CBS 617.96]